jgi:hypothetical protein
MSTRCGDEHKRPPRNSTSDASGIAHRVRANYGYCNSAQTLATTATLSRFPSALESASAREDEWCGDVNEMRAQ